MTHLDEVSHRDSCPIGVDLAYLGHEIEIGLGKSISAVHSLRQPEMLAAYRSAFECTQISWSS
ncbi:hypothetical protein WL96_12715 [Burkholderia vietnamiensis]|nr:hypothetical protein WL96_12715 [Burkholderia vietnamiensis]